MDVKISGAISAYQNAAGLKSSQGVAQSGGGQFANLIGSGIDGAIDTLKSAEANTINAMSDKVSIDELAVSVANAEMTLRTVVAVRDKVISAYQDIIKMPI